MSYPLLADAISSHPSLQIFQHFSDLNAKSLLYYQAELAQLEDELREVEEADEKCGLEPRSKYAKTFWRLRDSANDDDSISEKPSHRSRNASIPSSRSRSISPHRSVGGTGAACTAGAGPTSRQWKLIREIRVLLEEYYQALSRQLDIHERWPEPRDRALRNIREWLSSDIRMLD